MFPDEVHDWNADKSSIETGGGANLDASWCGQITVWDITPHA